jgi:hypothetical protein
LLVATSTVLAAVLLRGNDSTPISQPTLGASDTASVDAQTATASPASGPAGPAGSPGSPGKSGQQGKQGEQGKQGQKGPQGPQGSQAPPTAPPPLQDGTHLVFIESVDTANYQITVDVYSDGNIRTLPVDENAPITVNVLGEDISTSLAELAEHTPYYDPSETGDFHITMEAGSVIQIAETPWCSPAVPTPAPGSPPPTPCP